MKLLLAALVAVGFILPVEARGLGLPELCEVGREANKQGQSVAPVAYGSLADFDLSPRDGDQLLIELYSYCPDVW